MKEIKGFSEKQRRVLSWWADEAERKKYDAVICDGAVRSGKTTAVSVSFVLWAMECFSDTSFAICGKTVGAAVRNVVGPLRKELGGLYKIRMSGNELVLQRGRRVNRFYLFGGKDEGSAALIQGMTLGGVLLDEAALMPRSFVEQAMARCSEEGAKIWMSLNPEGPRHWLYTEWILKAEEKKVLRLHFTMDDNPALSEEVKARYRSMYTGVFYRRYVLGEWALADGLVYPMFDPARHLRKTMPEGCTQYVISIDYGTMNPFSAGLWGEKNGKWYRIREFYHNGREKGAMTDEEYYKAIVRLAGKRPVRQIVIDPSAASLIQCIRRHGKFSVRKARNSVLSGIQHVAQMLQEDRLIFSDACRDSIREFSLYVWEKGGRDQPVKENDHAMDEIRYFVETVVFGGKGLSF
jgi:PBSX family phage terminase large subunit